MLLLQSQMNVFRDMLQREVRESEERLQNHEKVKSLINLSTNLHYYKLSDNYFYPV